MADYRALSELQIQEWKQSLGHIKTLETMAGTVLDQSKQIQALADTLFTMIRDETESETETATEFHKEAIQDVQELAADIPPDRLYDRQLLDEILIRWSTGHQLFELLYILDVWGMQVSNNVYTTGTPNRHAPLLTASYVLR